MNRTTSALSSTSFTQFEHLKIGACSEAAEFLSDSSEDSLLFCGRSGGW